MKKLHTSFNPRQYMLSKDFELFYYSDHNPPKVELHAHDYYEFYVFLEGDVRMQIEQTKHSIQAGDIMLIPPHKRHRPIIHSNTVPYRRFVFWISQEYYNYLLGLSPDYGYLVGHVLQTDTYIFHTDQLSCNAIHSKMLRLLEELNGTRFGRNAQISLYVNDIILHLNRIIYNRQHPVSNTSDSSPYQDICMYIEEHLEEDLSLDRLSQLFFVSKFHISHIFKDTLGISIHQYITKKRLTRCQEAIRSGMSITEAYQSFGFGDYSSFYRAFKKEYSVSPKDFRDMLSPDSSPSTKESD